MRSSARARSIFAITGSRARPRAPPRERPNIVRGLDERLADRVDALLEREGETRPIALGERADPEIDVGDVDPFVGQQRVADRDLARDGIVADGLDHQLNQAVVEEDRIAGLHHLRQPAKVGRCPGRIPGEVADREREPVAALELDRLLGKPPDAQLRAGRSARIATRRRAACAALRMSAIVAACSSRSPWAKLRRATFMPASIIAESVSRPRDAGPMVQTMPVLVARWSMPVTPRNGAPQRPRAPRNRAIRGCQISSATSSNAQAMNGIAALQIWAMVCRAAPSRA